MRTLLLTIFFLLTTIVSGSQTFLAAYKKYRIENADTLLNASTKKKVKLFIRSQVLELDTIFKSYKARTNFDFNTADSLALIFSADAESPFSPDVLIWSGNDTISYAHEFEVIKPSQYRSIVVYRPFFPKIDRPAGFVVTTERDSLVTLVSKRDFLTISHLGDNQSVHDGSYVYVFVAYKYRGRYIIESCFPKKFMIQNIYRAIPTTAVK